MYCNKIFTVQIKTKTFDYFSMVQLASIRIDSQKAKVKGLHPEVVLMAPCKIGTGVLQLTDQKKALFTKLFEKDNFSLCFFVPASGSGSRMFQFLYDFLEAPEEANRGNVEKFLNHISEFAFFQTLPIEIQRKLKKQELDLDEFGAFLLENNGMGFGDLPKGLIPFHKNDPFILAPFQEHVLQGTRVKEDGICFHFTIQSQFKELIKKAISQAQGMTGQEYNVHFSEQSRCSNSVAFDAEGNVFEKENGELLERPAGHGALLENLNAIESDLICIKNIDNIQHLSKSEDAVVHWKVLGGVLLEYRTEAKRLFNNPSIKGLKLLNDRFQLWDTQSIANLNDQEIKELLNRPSRVCGMVKNEGQPGGGPFWINDNGRISKQIVEKSQITMKGEQYRLMVQSTYFNPVMIVLGTKDMSGEKFDLRTYVDDSKYFAVKKKYRGQDIRFIELPGLWNGSMAEWNSIFVEVPSATFSPVKTVLDLLENAHI
jgi:hypothetical protein